jgi:hypothetical protein
MNMPTDLLEGSGGTGKAPLPDDPALRAELERLERFARLLDDSIRVPGTSWRLGLDSLIGLLPAGGDVIGAALSMVLLARAARMGARRGVLARMAGNIAVDLAAGVIPVFGDVLDVAWKANRRNVRLLREHLERMGRVRPTREETPR